MNILAFDTAFDCCSVAAGRGLRSLSPSIDFRNEPMSTGQAERLLPMISEVLDETGLAVEQLDRIAIAIGPGTFTGTRIAVAAARALALIANTPVVGVTSLKLMAMSMLAHAAGRDELAVAIDARRGEVYFERFNPHTLVTKGGPALLPVKDAALMLSAGRSVVVGSGAEPVANEARMSGVDAIATAHQLLPDAFDMLFMAMEFAVVNVVQPLYLRPPDAKPQIGAALSRSLA